MKNGKSNVDVSTLELGVGESEDALNREWGLPVQQTRALKAPPRREEESAALRENERLRTEVDRLSRSLETALRIIESKGRGGR